MRKLTLAFAFLFLIGCMFGCGGKKVKAGDGNDEDNGIEIIYSQSRLTKTLFKEAGIAARPAGINVDNAYVQTGGIDNFVVLGYGYHNPHDLGLSLQSAEEEGRARMARALSNVVLSYYKRWTRNEGGSVIKGGMQAFEDNYDRWVELLQRSISKQTLIGVNLIDNGVFKFDGKKYTYAILGLDMETARQVSTDMKEMAARQMRSVIREEKMKEFEDEVDRIEERYIQTFPHE